VIKTTNEQANQLVLSSGLLIARKLCRNVAEVFRCQQVKLTGRRIPPPRAALNRACRPARWTIKAAGPTN
jgi:hypothetical protein